MAPQKSPAFQFYAKDFLIGTASMSLAERGAYVTLLAYEWDAGSVPDSARDRARILGCTAAQEKAVWNTLCKKFVRHGDAYINERLEEERAKQAEYRRRQSDKGKAGAKHRWQPDDGREMAGAMPEPLPEPMPVPQPNDSSSSPSPSSKDQEVTGSLTTKHRSGVIVGAAEYAKLQELFAFPGSILRVPHKLHAELLAKSGGAHRERELREWYHSLNESLEESGKGTGDVFEWLRPRHQSFARLRGWVEEAPKVNGVKRDDAAQLARLEAIERGERAR